MLDRVKTILDDVFRRIRRKEGPVMEHSISDAIYVDFTQVERETAGWVSPHYSISRTVKLDMNTLADNRCVSIFPYSREAEVYKVLRTQILRYTKETGGNTIMITSALPGEGKTTTAINLSFAFSKLFDQTVLLVDGDLRKQDIHRHLAFESDKGLSDYLLDDCPLSDLIIWPGIDKLTLISGGRLIHESTELLGSVRMAELVHEMKTRYPDRYVFFDTPPILNGADALAFVPLVDHIIIVVQAGVTQEDDVKRSLELIPQEKVAGFVLNRYRTSVKIYPARTMER